MESSSTDSNKDYEQALHVAGYTFVAMYLGSEVHSVTIEGDGYSGCCTHSTPRHCWAKAVIALAGFAAKLELLYTKPSREQVFLMYTGTDRDFEVARATWPDGWKHAKREDKDWVEAAQKEACRIVRIGERAIKALADEMLRMRERTGDSTLTAHEIEQIIWSHGERQITCTSRRTVVLADNAGISLWRCRSCAKKNFCKPGANAWRISPSRK